MSHCIVKHWRLIVVHIIAEKISYAPAKSRFNQRNPSIRFDKCTGISFSRFALFGSIYYGLYRIDVDVGLASLSLSLFSHIESQCRALQKIPFNVATAKRKINWVELPLKIDVVASFIFLTRGRHFLCIFILSLFSPFFCCMNVPFMMIRVEFHLPFVSELLSFLLIFLSKDLSIFRLMKSHTENICDGCIVIDC